MIEEFVTPGHVQFKYQQLPILANGPEAAEASECAAAQGHFWEFYDYTFENWGAEVFGNLNFKRTAETLGLDTSDFNRCLDTHQMQVYVEADLEAGYAMGASTTPTIVIGNTMIVGLQEYEVYRTVTINELARMGVIVN